MSGTIREGPSAQIISPRLLPSRLTLLQVLVWIATRNSALVLRVSLKEREVERANKELRPEAVTWFNPWQGDLLWKAVLWKHLPEEALLSSSQEEIEAKIQAGPGKRESLLALRDAAKRTYGDAIESLLDSLRRGRLKAFATFFDRPTVEMATDVWLSVTLECPGRAFLPFHQRIDGTPSVPVSAWSNAIIECPTDRVIELWPTLRAGQWPSSLDAVPETPGER